MSFAITLGVVGIGTKVFGAVQSYNALKKQAGEDKQRAEDQRLLLENLENNRQTLTNPYANLGVATQAAEMQIRLTLYVQQVVEQEVLLRLHRRPYRARKELLQA